MEAVSDLDPAAPGPFWVEILGRGREVVHRQRCAGPELRIGRAYDNDIVLDDPYVAPHHLRIFRDEAGALIAEDLGSRNGLRLGASGRRQARLALGGGETISIGHTQLRVRKLGFAVAAERPLHPAARIWPAAIALALAIFGIELLSTWLRETADPKWARYLGPLVMVTVPALVWTAGWAVLSRIFGGVARFKQHLVIALGGILFVSLFNELLDYLGFALAWSAPTRFAFIVVALAIATVIFLHLWQIGPTYLRLKGAVVLVLLIAALAVQWIEQSEFRADFDQADYSRRLLPSSLRLVAPQPEDGFFAAVGALKPELDRKREEPPRGGGMMPVFGAEDD